MPCHIVQYPYYYGFNTSYTQHNDAMTAPVPHTHHNDAMTSAPNSATVYCALVQSWCHYDGCEVPVLSWHHCVTRHNME